MKLKFIFKSLTVVCLVFIGQIAFGQYVAPEEAITRLQAEVAKFENVPDQVGASVVTNGTSTQSTSSKTPPSYYVRIMQNMIQIIKDKKAVAPAITDWETMSNQQQPGSRKNAIREIVAHVKTLLI